MSQPLLPKPRAVLFDWDDTLVDNWQTIHAALNAALEAYGHVPWTYEETRRRVARSLRDSFPEYFGAEHWERAREVFYETFAARHLEGLVVKPGADALLSDLAGRGVPVAVVSNKTGRFLRREAEHLGWTGRFHRLVGAGDAAEDKPARAVVELALAGSGLAPGPDVWLIGDNAIDVECAVRCGCTAILVGDGPLDAEMAAITCRAGDCTALLAHVADACRAY